LVRFKARGPTSPDEKIYWCGFRETVPASGVKTAKLYKSAFDVR
jgi:hypothetical protein